jgi:hypothetical protein
MLMAWNSANLQMVLQDKNEKMLCLTPQKRHMLVRMDTETGKSLSEMVRLYRFYHSRGLDVY